MGSRSLRNVAVIAHVDHGKTTLIDKILLQTGVFSGHQVIHERVMDSNALEKERGITIFSKNLAIDYDNVHMNIIDTPGHADFGGEVERVLSMVDGVLLLVDAVEGPMPQTLFVTQKALQHKLKILVVINKVDREAANPNKAISDTFDLLDRLGATDEQLDFPVIYASALHGWAIADMADEQTNMEPLLKAMIEHIPAPVCSVDGSFQLQISALDYSSYVGCIGIGRVQRGSIKPGTTVSVLHEAESPRRCKIAAVYGYSGLQRVLQTEAFAGDIVQIEGVDGLLIGTTLADLENPEMLPNIAVDQPSIHMQFMVNTSPLAGTEGKFVTSRQIHERLKKELLTNVSLEVTTTADGDVFDVAGRGELHLSILVENMRREGFELAVGRPRVIQREINGQLCEPYEMLLLDIEAEHQGVVMEALGMRKGELRQLSQSQSGRMRLEYWVSARALIGFHSEYLNMTHGTGLMAHTYDDFYPVGDVSPFSRRNGALISQETGNSVGFSLWKLQERGRLFIAPGAKVYEGMIIGIHSRNNDLVVNPIREKKLTNMRSEGKDENIFLTPPVQLTLEFAISFIDDDELVEVTPSCLRIRKRYLREQDRRRSGRAS